MDLQHVRSMILDYAARNQCWKTFDALDTDQSRDEVQRVVITLFAIQRLLKEDHVDKFENAIVIINRIYNQHSEVPYSVYWRLVMAMKITVFLNSITKDPPEVYLEKIGSLLCGTDILIHGEKQSELLKIKQKLWKLFCTGLPLISCADMHNKISGYNGMLLSRNINLLMDKLSSSVIQNLPPCELDLILRQEYKGPKHVTRHPLEMTLFDLAKDKSVLTDDELMLFLDKVEELEGAHEHSLVHSENDAMSEIISSQDICKSKEVSETSLLWNNDSSEDDMLSLIALSVSDEDRNIQVSETSLLWNKDSNEDDMLSLIAPSVSDEDRNIQLSDLEQDAEFEDNIIESLPNLGLFLKNLCK